MDKGPALIVAFVVAIVSVSCIVGITLASEDDENADRIGIIGAMEGEVASLKDSMYISQKVTVAGMEFCIGTLDGKNVVIAQCGMGKVNAGICANTMINQFHATRIINTGVAGSLAEVGIGDIVISTAGCQHDFDVSPIGFQRAEIPYTGLKEFPADSKLIADAERALATCAPGTNFVKGLICSGDQFIDSASKKNAILEVFPDGICCEMEGGAVAQTCYLNGVPFVIIRAISDNPDGTGTDDYAEFEKEMARKCANIVHYLVSNCS